MRFALSNAVLAAALITAVCVQAAGSDGQTEEKLMLKEEVSIVARAPEDSTLGSTSVVVSPDQNTVAFVVEKGGGQAAVVSRSMGRWYDQIGTIKFGSESRRVAYAARRGRKWFAVIDGHEEGPYEKLVWPIAFSPDSRSVAYAARRYVTDLEALNRVMRSKAPLPAPDKIRGNCSQWVVVVDGKEQSPFYDDVANVTFSPDSSRLAYSARRGFDKEFVVVDGKEGHSVDAVYWEPVFSPDSRRLAWVALDGGKLYVFVDGKKQGPYDSTGDTFFSPDSNRLAFVATKGKRRFMVVEGKREKRYDSVPEFGGAFSPDSTHIAYPAEKDGLWRMVVDGKEGPGYESVSEAVFSPDSSRLAYVASEGGKHAVMLGGKRGKSYDYSFFGMTFSPDSRRLAYWAKQGNETFVVIDGLEQSAYAGSGWGPVFSPDSKHVAYVAGSGAGYRLVVDGREGTVRCVDVLAAPVFDSPRHLHFVATREGGREFVRVDVELLSTAATEQ